jgi:glycosyltransferase involved in cell wall biosynthesis
MSEGRIESSPEVAVRPVFLVDKPVFAFYASYIRRILVGLTGSANASALVSHPATDLQAILCPAVESFVHPALQLPIFWNQNRKLLLSQLYRFKPTVLHTFYPGQIRLAHWLSDQLDVPYVVSCHQRPSRRICFEKSMSHAAALIAPSEPIAAGLTAKCPKLKSRTERIHIASFVADECCCFSREPGVTSLIAVHPFDSFELFESFLNAVRHLVLEGHEIMVALMGEGKAEKAIRTHIRKLGLTSIVTVIPPIRPIRKILSGADIYVHLSDNRRFDAQLLEAMAVGLAVVGSPEQTSGLLYEDRTAMCWDPTDQMNIYDRLKKVLSARERTRQLALNGQAHLRKYNSVSGMVDRLMQTYIEAQQWHK